VAVEGVCKVAKAGSSVVEEEEIVVAAESVIPALKPL